MTQNKTVRSMAAAALCAAVLAVLSPLSIPIGPVPITLAVLVIAVLPYAVGWKLAALGTALYLAIGALGLPVFSGFEGGFHKLIGPTGGFLFGYIPLVVIGGVCIEKSEKRYLHFAGLAAALVLLYAVGTVWLKLQANLDLAAALKAAVLPFIPLDAAKLVAAVLIGPVIKNRVRTAKKGEN